MTKFDQNDCV